MPVAVYVRGARNTAVLTAHLEAEGARSNKVGPLGDLGEVGSAIIGELCREEERSKRVSTLICTVWVFLASLVAGLQTNLRLVEVSHSLDVAWGLHAAGVDRSAIDKAVGRSQNVQLNPLDGTLRQHTRAVLVGRAVGNHDCLFIGHDLIWRR